MDDSTLSNEPAQPLYILCYACGMSPLLIPTWRVAARSIEKPAARDMGQSDGARAWRQEW